MPRYDPSTPECVQDVNELIETNLKDKDAIAKFKFLSQIDELLNKSNQGQVHLKPHVLFARRAAVIFLVFEKSLNYAEVARMLDVPINVVKKDIYVYQEALEHKKRQK